MKIRKRWILFFIIILAVCIFSIPEMIHQNKGVSISTGSVRNGKLQNGWLMPFKGKNFHYFSQVSYFLGNNAYMHSDVYATLMAAYKTCEQTCPGREFILMECSQKRGGRMLLHWTHQNGVSADFMVPKKKREDFDVWPDHAGIFHYLFKFDEDGKFSLSKEIEIDFESMARHIIALDDAAKKHGLRIRKVLFNTNLHDNLFETPSGKILAERDINFMPRLSDFINKIHDDHYHVDFESRDNVD